VRVRLSEQETETQFHYILTNFKYAVSVNSTSFRRPIGPLHYRAPETWGKTVSKDAGAAIDMWSVGVLLLELVSTLEAPEYI
jgi:serine/threonine protein kinase